MKREFEKVPRGTSDRIMIHLSGMSVPRGPGCLMGRPYADTLSGSRHLNLKELHFDAGHGVWRVAFAFDPYHTAVLLAAGDK